MFVYAVTNHKGGVGKTTAAATLGAAFVRLGRRVLLVDLDPQASLTAAVGATPAECSIEHVIETPLSVGRAIVPCASGMEILPARATLAIKLAAVSSEPNASRRIALALNTLEARFDAVLIDCPAGMGAGMANGLIAADIALVPILCDFLALRGLADTQEICRAIALAENSRLRVRVFATMFDRRTTYAADVLAEAREALGPRILDAVVPRSVRFAEAPAAGMTLLDFAPKSPGAAAYRSLAQELLEEEKDYGTTGRHPSSDTQPARHFGGRGAETSNVAAVGF